MKPLHHWLASTGCWSFALGIHQVLFAWLITIELGESAERLGYAQVAFTLPSTIFVLLAGALADQHGGRRIAVGFQLLSLIAPVALLVTYWQGALTYTTLIVYALVIGIAQAFVLPARDGLVALVAKDNVQRAIVLASIMQFGFQVIGFSVAGFAERVGVMLLLITQSLALLLGAYFLTNVRTAASEPARVNIGRSLVSSMLSELAGGAKVILGIPTMRAVLILNFSMGVFFMGSYIVALPILVRDFYGGGADEIALVNIVNSIGLISTLVLLVRIGNLARPGRALLISQIAGGCCYGLSGSNISFTVLLGLIFAWGACGGIAITMARTLAQTLVSPDLRARAMSFYILSFIGAAPLGAMISGWLAERFGAPATIQFCSAAVVIMAFLIHATTQLASVKPVVTSK